MVRVCYGCSFARKDFAATSLSSCAKNCVRESLIQRQAAELYAEGGLEKLTDAFISSTALMRRYIIRPEVGEEFRKSILEDRNQQHANGILKALKRYPRCKIFAFVGAGHLSDVLKLLREAGYECVSI